MDGGVAKSQTLFFFFKSAVGQNRRHPEKMKAHFPILMLLVFSGGLTALMNRFCQIRNVFFMTAGGKWCRKSL